MSADPIIKTQEIIEGTTHAYELDELLEPKALLMGELWPSEFFRISQKMARYLLQLDEHGHIIANNNQEESTSNHRVSFLPNQEGKSKEVYFKVNGMPALNPSREYMLSSLYQKLDIQVPATGLLILDHVKLGETYAPDVFVLQASQAIQGLSGKKVLKEKLTLPLNAEHYSKQVIGAMLTSPIDGKADNYIVTSLANNTYGWVSIDNDEVFQPPIRRDNSIHLKSAVLLLPEMDQPTDDSTYKYLSTLIPEMLLLEWMEELHNQEQRYNTLKQVLTFQGPKRKGGPLSIHHIDELWNQLSLYFSSFNPSIIPTLKHLISTLQSSFKKNKKNWHPSLQELFAECYPTIAPSYQDLRQAHPQDLYAALEALYLKNGEEGLKRGAPLNGHDHEIDYFKEGPENLKVLNFKEEVPSTISKYKNKLLSTIQERDDKAFLDQVLQAYRAQAHYKLPFVKSALKSLKLLAQEGFTSLQNARIAAEVYAKGMAEIQDLQAASNTQALPHPQILDQGKSTPEQTIVILKAAWQAAFHPFRKQHDELNWFLTLEEHFLQGWNHQEHLPKVPTEIKGAFMGRRMLIPSMASVILDQQGKFKKNHSLSGRAETTRYPKEKPLFYFKKHPELPACETAATSFMRCLGMTHVPRSELLIFHDLKEGPYPVLLTEAILGEPVYQAWLDDNNFKNLDPIHTGLLIIASMLLNPEDQKEDNFILSLNDKYLVPIDNDHVFLPGAIQVNGRFQVYPQLQTKTLAFSLEEMRKPLPSSLVQTLITLNCDQLLQQWMQELCFLQDAYQMLPNQTVQLWKNKNVTLKLPLSCIYIEGLYRKFHLLQKLLTSEPTITPLDLLSKLEPYIGKHYKQALSHPTLKSRFTAATESLYQAAKNNTSSRLSVSNSRKLMEIINLSDKELMAQMTAFRSGTTAALEQLVKLQRDNQDPNSLVQRILREETIERKPLSKEEEQQKIKDIFESARPYNVLEIPYSSLLKLAHFHTFNFQNKGHYITVADLRGAQHMREEELMALQQSCPNLLYLNISGWSLETLANIIKIERNWIDQIKLQEISNLTLFKELERLIAFNCLSLKSLNLYLPKLKSLELSQNIKLEFFKLEAPELRHLDVRGNSIIEEWTLSINDFKQLFFKGVDLKVFKELEGPSIDLRNRSLRYLEFYYLLTLTQTTGPLANLINLDLWHNNIGDKGAKAISICPTLTNLTSLNLRHNNIGDKGAKAISISSILTNLTSLNLWSNAIGNDGIKAIRESTMLTNLKDLRLELSVSF